MATNDHQLCLGSRKLIVSSVAAALGTGAVAASSAELEEIVVTARQRLNRLKTTDDGSVSDWRGYGEARHHYP